MCWVLDNAFPIYNVTASFLHDKYLYVGNDDFCIRIFNTLNASLHRVLKGHTSIITGFAYSNKYDLLFSVGIDGNIITWLGNSLIYKYTYLKPPLNRFPASIYSIYYCDDLDVIVIGLDGEIATFELSTVDFVVDNTKECPFKLRQLCRLHSDRVHLISGGKRRIFTASFDRTINSATIIDVSINKQISKHQTAVSTMFYDDIHQNLIVGDNSGIIRTFSADGLSLGPIAEGLDGSVTSLYFDKSLHLLWFVLSTGAINVIDMAHNNQFLGDHFQIFKNLPHPGSDKVHFECVLGNGRNTRICSLVNKKYAFTWKWSEFAYSFKLDMPNKPVTKLFAFNYDIFEHFFAPKKRPSSKSLTMELNNHPRINSSLVNSGLNLFVGGSKVIASRPISEFVYTNSDVFQQSNCTAIDFIYAESAIIMGYKSGGIVIVSLATPNIYMEEHLPNIPVTIIVSIQSFAITIGDDMSMALWDAHENLEIINRRERIHDDYVTCAAVCEERRVFITCDEAGFCRIWSIDDENKTGRRRSSVIRVNDEKDQTANTIQSTRMPLLQVVEDMLIDHSSYGAISHVSYSKSSDCWIFASQDGYVRAWPILTPTGNPIFSFCVLPCHVTAMAAGLRQDVYIATDDKTIRSMQIKKGMPIELGVYTGHTDIITQICVPPSYSAKRWVSLQWNGEVYFWGFRACDMSSTPPSNVTSNMVTRRDKKPERVSLPQLNTTTREQPVPIRSSSTKANLAKIPSRVNQQTSTTSLSVEKEKPISFYDKARKTLLLKRREEERQLKMMKKSHTWRMLSSMAQQMETAMDIYEAEKKKSREKTPKKVKPSLNNKK